MSVFSRFIRPYNDALKRNAFAETTKVNMNERIKELQAEMDRLMKQLESEKLLQDIWLELGPYTPHLSNELRYKLQDHFNFDDSE